MAYKKKKTFFYAGSQKLPDPKAETHHAPPGYNSGTVSTGNGGAGGGYKFSRFQRYNNDEEDSFNSEPPAAVIPLDKKKKITVRSFRGIKLVDIREFYQKRNDDGMQQEFPGKKGISLTEETWNSLLSQASQVQEALKSLDSPGSSVKSTTTNVPIETIGHKDTIPIEEVGRKRSNDDQQVSNLTKKPKKEPKAIKEQDLVDSDIDSEEEEELLQSNHPTASLAVKPNTNEEDDSSDDDDAEEHDIKDLHKDDDDDDAAAALEAAMMEDSDASEEE